MGIRGAVSVTGKQRVRYPTPYCVTLYSALKGPGTGSVSAIRIKVGARDERPHTQYVLGTGPDASCMPMTAAQPATLCRNQPRHSAPARSHLSGLSVRWRAAGWLVGVGVTGPPNPAIPRSPPAECPANLVLRRESAAVFVPRRSPGAGRLRAEDGRQMAEAGGKVWVGLMVWDWERPLALGRSRLFATAGM